jgi:hypothetical protein
VNYKRGQPETITKTNFLSVGIRETNLSEDEALSGTETDDGG